MPPRRGFGETAEVKPRRLSAHRVPQTEEPLIPYNSRAFVDTSLPTISRSALKKHRDSVPSSSPPPPPSPVGFIYLFHVQRQRSRGIFITWEGKGESGAADRLKDIVNPGNIPNYQRALSFPPPSLSLSLSYLSCFPSDGLSFLTRSPLFLIRESNGSSASRRRSSSSTIRQGRR